MNFKKLIKNYKIPLTLSLLAVIGVSFVIGAVSLATNDGDNIFRKVFAASPVGYHDSNIDSMGAVNGWVADADNKDRDISFRIYAKASGSNNEVLVRSGVANKYRPDLETAGVCNGGTCAIGEFLTDLAPGTYNIRIVALDTNGSEVNLINTNKSLTIGSTGSNPGACTNPDPARDIQVIDDVRTFGSNNTAKVKNNSTNCTYTVGLASYEAFLQPTFPLSQYSRLQEFIDTQKLFAQDLKQVAPGATVSLTVPHSQCTVWQVDLFSGPNAPVPPDFWALRNSGYHLFDWEISGTLNSCQTTPPPTPTTCVDPNPGRDITIVPISVSGLSATARATNNSTVCSYKMHLASYEAFVNQQPDFQRFIDTQKLFDSDSKNLAPGQSANFRVDLPACTLWQVDFFTGPNVPAIPNFHLPILINAGYGNFDAEVGGALNSCPVTPPNDLNVVCVQSADRIEAGRSVSFTANATGGNGAYTYAWSSNGLTGSNRNFNRTFYSTGQFRVDVTVTSGGQSDTASCDVSVYRDVAPDPTLGGSCQGIPSTVNIGQTVNWSAQASGGTGSYNFNWSGAVTGSGSSRTATYSTTGVKNASVVITSGSQSITRNCSVNVIQEIPPLNVVCQGNPAAANVGQNITWTSNATGGTGSYTYSWSGTDGLSGNTQNATRAYSTTGTKNATVTVTSGSQSRTASCAVNISAAPIALDGSCLANPTSVNAGQNINWAANATGGTGSYTYSWSGSDDLSGGSQNITRAYTSAGTKQATVVITSGGNSVTRTCQATVINPVATLGVSCSASGSNYRVGDNITWSSNPTGGTGSYTYSWSGTDGLSSNSQNTSRSYGSTGTKTGTITVTSGGQSAQATCQVTISDNIVTNPALNVSCSANPSSVSIGQNVTWSSNVSGGTGFYNYYWSGTDNLSSNNQSVNRSYDTAGTKSGTITVTSGGQTSSAVCNVVVGTANIILTTNPVPNPLSFVYLNQIPYTGLMDDMGKVGKMFMLIAWSALVAFIGLKFWNKREQFAFAGGVNVEESNSVVGKLKNVFASIIPGAFESPYVAIDTEAVQDEELAEEDVSEVEGESEEETEEQKEVVADIEALSTLAMDRRALISRQALGAIYEDHSGDFEEASLDLLKVIGRAALAYPREDGWIVLNSERLQNLR